MANLKRYTINPLSQSVLREEFCTYASPKDKISRLEQERALIRLRRGLYVVSPEVTGQELSQELIANHLQGPSYLSYETALSYYGLIPERVVLVRSATMSRSKSYVNSLGEYEYITVPEQYFPVGLRIQSVGNAYNFIIASPEKALCDLIMATSGLRLQSVRAVRAYLTEDLRIDDDAISHFDHSIVHECSLYGYKRNELSLLHNLIRHEQNI